MRACGPRPGWTPLMASRRAPGRSLRRSVALLLVGRASPAGPTLSATSVGSVSRTPALMPFGSGRAEGPMLCSLAWRSVGAHCGRMQA